MHFWSAKRIVLLILAATLALLAGPGVGSASAHAYLTSSSPTDGESLTAAPAELRLEFSEHVVLESTHIVVTDGSGHTHPVTNLRADDATAPNHTEAAEPEDASTPWDEAAAEAAGVVDTEVPLALVADLPTLPAGAYHVTWETLSSDDLHRTAGGFAFGVNTAVIADVASGVTETPPDLLDAVGRWLVCLGLAVALGGALVSRLLRRCGPGRADALATPLRRVAAGGALAAGATAAVWFALDLARVGTGAVSTSYAARWALREAALLLLALVLARGWRAVSTVTAALAACVGTVLLGHTGQRGGATWTVASSLHLASTLTWFGAVVALAWLALRHRRLGLGSAQLRALLRSFLTPASVLVAVVAVTGLYLAGDVVVSVDAVLGTVYGRVLLAKVLVVAAAGLLAATTSRRLHRPSPIDSAPNPIESAENPIDSAPNPIESAVSHEANHAPYRRITVEATGLGIALALAAVLASGQPAISPALVDAAGPTPSRILDQTADGLQESLVVAPNRPGSSVVTVDVFDARRPSPGPVTGVSVSIPADAGARVAPSTEAHRLSQYRWAAGIAVRGTGSMPIVVTVRRQGLPPTVTTFDWVVGAPGATPAAVVSRAPISGLLQAAALGLLATLLLAASILARRARARARRSDHLRPPPLTPSTDPGRQRTEVGTR